MNDVIKSFDQFLISQKCLRRSVRFHVRNMEEIPVIDISSYLDYEKDDDLESIKSLLEEWNGAFSEIGFVIITGHDVPDAVCRGIQDDAVSFFTQELQEKMKCSLNNGYGNGGYVAKGHESVSKTVVFNEKENDTRLSTNNNRSIPDYVETLEFIRGLEDDKKEFILPNYPDTFAKNMEAYWSHVSKLANRLFEISALALGLEKDYFQAFFEDNYERLRFAFYPAQDKVKPVKGQLRYGPHTDYACFAMVRQDDSPGGLEVLNTNGKWIPVKNVPGSFVVNCGDLLQRWTNNCWKSVVHKVVNPPDKKANTHRLSTVLFVGPNRNAVIEPLKVCCTEENPSKYKPIGCKEHLDRKIKISSH